jgi:hypothetical protein
MGQTCLPERAGLAYRDRQGSFEKRSAHRVAMKDARQSGDTPVHMLFDAVAMVNLDL